MELIPKTALFLMLAWVCGSGLANAVEPATHGDVNRVWLDQSLTPADARHLLARTGFDAAPEAQRLLTGLTRRQAIEAVMDGFSKEPQRPMPAWTRDVAPLYWTRRDLNQEQQRNFDRLRDSELAQLRNWWVDEMLTTTSPQTERMVLFWHDHFATNYRGINRQSMAIARQNQTFRELGMGNFKTLLTAMIRDPALLHYLNNTRNYKAKPNENLARELLELFTLGEGNYDEATVREAARALTGYGVSQNRNLTARFDHWQHDFEEKTLFGETGNFNGDDLVTLLVKQPALDRFIASRFWHLLVADRTPSDNELQPFASAFRDSGHELGVLYRTILESESFWHEQNRGALIKSPATLLIGTARTLDTPKRINQQLPRMLKLSGQDLFAPPNVSGWKEGAPWITPGRLLNRYTALEELLRATREEKNNKPNQSNAIEMSANTLANSNSPNGMSVTNGMNDMTMSNSMNDMSMSDDSGDGMMASANMMSGGMTTDAGSTDAMAESMAQPTVEMHRKPHALSIKLASEEFNGPAKYRIELLSNDESVVWSADEQELVGGWDTVRYGTIDSRDQLPWQTVPLAIEPSLLSQGNTLRVHFTNDDAGDTGDRNLYVGSLSSNQIRMFPTAGSQSSFCSPPNGADAGDLYCAGYVDINVSAIGSEPEANRSGETLKNTLRYASNHLEWARLNNNGTLHVRLVFQDVRLGQRHWPVLSAWYHIDVGGEPHLWLSNEGCWPDCVEQWPPCAWDNERDPTLRMLSFSALGSRGDQEKACHVNALNDDEALLVDALLLQSTDILTTALEREKNQFPTNRRKIKETVAVLIDRLEQPDVRQSFKQRTPTGRNALSDIPTWVQDDTARRPYPQDPSVRTVPIIANSLLERHEQLIDAGFTWNTALAPGVPVSDLPGWENPQVQFSERAELYEHVRSWLLNPTYQVY